MDFEQLLAELRRLRRTAGLSQTDLGERLGLGRVQTGNIENGHAKTVNIDRLQRWAEVLNHRIDFALRPLGADPVGEQEPVSGLELHLRVGAALRQLRKARGLSSTELGRRLRVTHTAVLDWESGKSAMSLQRLDAYSTATQAKTVVEVLPSESRQARVLDLMSKACRHATDAELAGLEAMFQAWLDERADPKP